MFCVAVYEWGTLSYYFPLVVVAVRVVMGIHVVQGGFELVQKKKKKIEAMILLCLLPRVVDDSNYTQSGDTVI